MIIKKIFKIIGAADAAANLLCEFKIAPKKDDKLTNKRKGKVILVKLIVISSLYEFSVKPGAIKKTNQGINISTTKTKNKITKVRKLKMLLAIILALFFPLLKRKKDL